MEDKAIGLLLEIKSDIGNLRGEVGEIKGELKARPCLEHQKDIRDLRCKVDAVDARVDQIHAKDLPELRASVASITWWSSRKGKVIGGLVGLLLAIATGAATALVIRGVEGTAPTEKMEITQNGQNR